MVESTVSTIVRKYFDTLPSYGIQAERAILFGSFAKGVPAEWSDIDILIVAPEFDQPHTIDLVKKLWIATKNVDYRIEPVACGVKEWESDDSRPILEIARREGIEVAT